MKCLNGSDSGWIRDDRRKRNTYILCSAKNATESPNWFQAKRWNIARRAATDQMTGLANLAYRMAACSICVTFIDKGFWPMVHCWWQYVITDRLQQQQQLNTTISLCHSFLNAFIRSLSCIGYRPFHMQYWKSYFNCTTSVHRLACQSLSQIYKFNRPHQHYISLLQFSVFLVFFISFA